MDQEPKVNKSQNLPRSTMFNHKDIWLVGYLYLPLWQTWKSLGIMKFPTEWKHKIHVPNHQPNIAHDHPGDNNPLLAKLA